MRFVNVRIKNYKSWLDSEVISFNKGLNIIVGQNNAGKTALLEALSLSSDNKPHITEITKPESDSSINSISEYTVTLQFDENELLSFAYNLQEDYFIPISHDNFSPDEAIRSTLEKLFFLKQ